jgi:hypothetical protein
MCPYKATVCPSYVLITKFRLGIDAEVTDVRALKRRRPRVLNSCCSLSEMDVGFLICKEELS